MARDRDVAAFGERAQRYDDDEGWLGELHHQIADRTADLALTCVPAPRRILDVGCGIGYLLGRLAAHAPQAEAQRAGLAQCARVLAPGGCNVLADLFSMLLLPTLLAGRRGKARTKRRATQLVTAAELHSPHWHHAVIIQAVTATNSNREPCTLMTAMRDVRTKRVGDVGCKPGVFDPGLGRSSQNVVSR